MLSVIHDAENYPELGRASVKLRLFARLMADLREAAESLPLDQLFDYVLDKTGYEAALRQKGGDEELARLENIGELKTNIISYMNETGDDSLAGFLDEVALYTDIDSMSADADAVTMMTMHTAKGLEFDNVYIVGVEEGVFPSARCIGEPEEMEEERRLCYVGMTRARKKLTLCCARQRMIFGMTSSNLPSRFVDEIPEECLERTGAAENDSFSSGEYNGRGAFTHSSYSMNSSYGRSNRDTSSYRKNTTSYVERRESFAKKPLSSKTPSAPAPADFKTGDRVHHKAFGEGEIVKMTPMGGDHLIEVQFGDTLKKLMLRAAAPNMEKI